MEEAIGRSTRRGEVRGRRKTPKFLLQRCVLRNDKTEFPLLSRDPQTVTEKVRKRAPVFRPAKSGVLVVDGRAQDNEGYKTSLLFMETKKNRTG